MTGKPDTDQTPTNAALPNATRRTVLRAAGLAAVAGGGVGVLAACSGDAETTDTPDTTEPTEVTVATADIPEGGGVVVDQRYVVTQPTAGDFKAFTAICTHQGCVVEKVEQQQIVCPCHGSHFSIADGSPTAGPAKAPLATVDVSVSGDQVTLSG
jgi:Rieske Fe-S protein